MLTFVVSAQIRFPFFGRDSFGRRVQQSHRSYLDLKQTHTKRNAFKNRPTKPIGLYAMGQMQQVEKTGLIFCYYCTDL